MADLLNNVLNRISMYKLVSISLMILWVVAFVLSLVGIISFSPLAMIASAIVLTSVTYLASLFFGRLFGIRVHGESSLITGLILFFIFTPSIEVSALVTFSLIGMVAAASKFVLAFRGRHIFNPVAAAAFFISLTGLSFATWWVATPPLTIVTGIMALLFLYKTRRLAMGLTFLLVATPLVLLTFIKYGSGITESFALLLSWPLVFFVGFMLSEPLTMPKKKWQQILEAIIVGILFALPIHIGEFSTTPVFALLIGNLAAFGVSRRQAISLQLKSRHQLTPTAYEFTFTPLRPVTFEAGQYMELTLPHQDSDGRGLRRTFSMTSSPSENEIKFGVKFYKPSSSFKKALQSLPVGSIIQATGVNGDFTLPNDAAQPLLFIAGGIGVTPFISHLLYLKSINRTRDIIMMCAVSSIDDLAYGDILQHAGIKVLIVTKTDAQLLANTWTHINESRITTAVLKANVPDIASRQVYVSGPPPMIDSAKRHLKELNVQRVKTDYFIGY